MFKIEYIQFNNQNPICFNQTTFVYGGNSSGKSILFKAIYYILGHSDENGVRNFWLSDGLKNVKNITCKLTNDSKELFLLRNDSHEFYFKQSNEEKFILVNRDQYISKIQTFILNYNGQYSDLYYEATENRLTFRGFIYMNFIDEYSLGLTNCIYSCATDASMYSRIHDQMAYIFDYNRLLNIVKMRKEIDEKEKVLASNNLQIEKELYLRGVIKDTFDKLKLKYSDSMNENKKTFSEYLNNKFEQKIEKDDKDLVFLLTVSAELENQINSLKIYSLQSKQIEEDYKSENVLLNFYKSILITNDEYRDYVNAIQNQINDNLVNYSFLEAKDDETTLQMLQQKKMEVDAKIASKKRMLKKTNYVQRQVWIDSLQKAFDEYSLLSSVAENEKIQADLGVLKKTLRSEEKAFKGSINPSLNKMILDKYSNFKSSGIDFVEEDFNQEAFDLMFVPSTLSIIAKRNVANKTKASSSYNAGSKARLTIWQLLTCISIIEFINKVFNGFPILPMLVIDGIHEPFDDAGVLEKVYEQLKQNCECNGIQLIVTSARKLNGNVPFDVDISDGLNKEFNK